MRMTKDEQIGELKASLKAREDSETILLIAFIVSAILLIISGFVIMNMDSKFNEQKRALKSRTQRLNYYLDERIKARQMEVFEGECRKLASISKKGFRIVTEFISAKPACMYGQVFLYSDKEIQDAIKHYELGGVGK